MRVAVVQHDIVWEDAEATRKSLEDRIADAAPNTDLVVLTEMFATGFSMDVDRIAEPYQGPTEQWMREEAVTHGVTLVGSVAQQDAQRHERAVNRAVLAAPDGTARYYDKIHPFTFAREHEYYRAGTDHLTTEIAGARVSVFICYDLRFADEFWARAHDTDAYVVVANWPAKRREHWRALLRARAIENQAWVVAANRVGDGDGIHYSGDSVVLDPLGRAVVEAAEIETVLTADVRPELVDSTRAHYPFLQDRREDRREGRREDRREGRREDRREVGR